MFASLKSAVAAMVASLLVSEALLAAEDPHPLPLSQRARGEASFDSLWKHLADRPAAEAYRAARQMIERGDEAVAFLAAKIPAEVRLPRRVPYEKPQDLQLHRAAYVLECIGGKEAMSVRARISYAPAAALELYQEKPRVDPLGDPLPMGAVFRWGSDRFFLANGRAGLLALSSDGKLAAVAPIGYAAFRRFGGGDDGGGIKILDVVTGKTRAQVPCLGMRPTRLHFTRDNKRLVYSADGQIVAVDIATGTVVNQIAATAANLNTFALSGDERTIYTGHADGSFAAYEFPGGKRIAGGLVAGHPILRLQVSPDFVGVECTGATGAETRLWDVKRKDWTAKKNWGEIGSRYALAPDGKRYAVLKSSGNITVRGMADDKLQKELTGKLPPNVPTRTGRERFEFLDSEHLLLSDWMGNSTVISVDSGKVLWSGRTVGVRMDLSASADGRYLLGYTGARLQIIDLVTGRNLVDSFLARLSNPYLTISGDGGTVLAVREQRVWQLDPSTLEPLGEVKMEGHPVSLSHDGRFCAMQEPTVICEPASGTTLLPLEPSAGMPWPATNGIPVRRSQLYSPDAYGANAGAARWFFHPNGRWLLAENRPGMASKLIDLWTGAARVDRAAVVMNERCYSPDAHRFLYRDQQNQGWACCDAATGGLLWHGPGPSFDYGSRPQWFAGGQFAAFACGAALEICEAQDGRVVDTIRAGSVDVRNAAVAPDGESVALADGACARLYERRSRKLMYECPARGLAVSFLANGRFLEVVDTSGMTTICDLSSAAARRRDRETTVEELERLWPDLGGEDAGAAFAASWAFVGAGDEGVDFLRQRLAANCEASDEQIRGLIAALDSERYEMRHAAYLRLLGQGKRILAQLRQAADNPASLELKLALERLVRALESNQEPALLPRAGFILRQMGTPRAEELLAKLGEYSAQKAFAPQPSPRGP